MKFPSALCVAILLVFAGGVHADVRLQRLVAAYPGVVIDVARLGHTNYGVKQKIGLVLECGAQGQLPVCPVHWIARLKGRDAAFVRKALTDFRSGARNNPVMNAMAAGLKDAEIEHLADYIDSLR